MARLLLALLVVCFGSAEAFTAGLPAQGALRTGSVSMNTQYTVAAGLAKKKNPKTGSTIFEATGKTSYATNGGLRGESSGSSGGSNAGPLLAVAAIALFALAGN